MFNVREFLSALEADFRRVEDRESCGLPADGFPTAVLIPLRAKYLPR